MRLICPNCSAQYEIDASLIPDEGRDVQCSNCGHNWYELPPAPEAVTPPPDMEIAPEADVEEVEEVEEVGYTSQNSRQDPEPTTTQDTLAADVEDDAPSSPVPEMPAGDDALEERTEPSPAAVAQDEEDEDWDWPETPAPKVNVPEAASPATDRPRRPADLAALEILKEEADRELARREEEAAAPIESQPDLALEDPRDRNTPSRALRARMARLRGEDEEEEEEDDGDAETSDEPPEEDDAYREPRKDLLPDIEEINSSLRPAGLARSERSEEEEAEHRRGFRIGFIGVVAIVVVMIIAYTQAPAIASVFPSSEAALIGYVDWANGVRDALGGLMGGST